jgi:hypothetical protein
MNRFFVAVCFASICWMCSSLHAQDGASTPKTACTTGNLLAEPPNRVKAITVFWDELEAAIRKNDKRRVANLISYPLSVSTWTAEFRVRSEGELISRYDEVFPKDLKKLLLRQRAECISRVGAQGFSIGHGEIWFDLFPNGKVRIFTINPVEPDAGGLPLNPDRGGQTGRFLSLRKSRKKPKSALDPFERYTLKLSIDKTTFPRYHAQCLS